MQKQFCSLRGGSARLARRAIQLSLGSTFFLCLASSPNANAQNVSRKLEVASIRPAAYPSDDYFQGFASFAGACNNVARPQVTGNVVIITRVSLCQMLGMAFAVQDFRIIGVPQQMLKIERSNFFDVRLKAEGEAALTADEARELMKAALAERFQLKLHTEMKPIPVYELTIGKNGTKLKVTPEEGRSKQNGVPMITYVGLISKYVDRPVVDRTGLTDTHYAYQWNETELRRDLANGLPVALIFREVEEQLGLSLKPAIAPYEVVIVDHAEPPSEN